MNYSEKPIREWQAEDRPREKMMRRGIESLTDAELLATMIASGTQKMSAIDLARHLITEFGGLRMLSRATVNELIKVKGVGQAKATAIAAAFELARRKLAAENQVVHFRSSADIARYLVPTIGDLPHEVFYVLSLDRQNKLLGESEVHRGGVGHVPVDAKMVFKEAINRLASSIVVCHNHPSGSVLPSKADDSITFQLVCVSKLLDIRILDHVIVARRDWYSYADLGRLGQMEREAGLLKEQSDVVLQPTPPNGRADQRSIRF